MRGRYGNSAKFILASSNYSVTQGKCTKSTFVLYNFIINQGIPIVTLYSYVSILVINITTCKLHNGYQVTGVSHLHVNAQNPFFIVFASMVSGYVTHSTWAKVPH